MSQFRRPWSPILQREPSYDVSVEPLDLSDYDMTLESSTTYYTPPPEEIDISHFPKWSQGWYDKPIHADFDLPDPNRKSVFDPGYVHNEIYTPVPSSSFDLPDPNRKSVFDPGYDSSAHDSTRTLLPWSNDAPRYELPLQPALREERMRMLEKEFGNKSKGTKKDDPLLDQNGKPIVGSIDDQGRLVTVGPKKRVFIRVLQILLAITAAVPSIYAALVSLFPLLSLSSI
jgi:hypothetical protein